MFRGNQRRVRNKTANGPVTAGGGAHLVRRGTVTRSDGGQRFVYSTNRRNADGTRTWVGRRQLNRIVDYVNAVSGRGGSGGC